MMHEPFHVGGGITDEYSQAYIERAEDQVVFDLLNRGSYVLIVEPRQQGKTSLINALMRKSDHENDPLIVYANITTFDTSDESGWYHSLCTRMLKQLRFLPREHWPAIPNNSFAWRDFLSEIALAAGEHGHMLVVALDEIGSVSFPGAVAFFSVLRDIFNARQGEREFRQITFLLAGAFHPRDLITDIHVSPFNIARRVRLHDFDMEQVIQLVTLGGWSKERCVLLAQRIFDWTGGQPYLTQYICAQLSAEANPEEVDICVEYLRREDENHLPAIINRLEREHKIRAYLRRIFQGENIRFYPGENRRQAELDVLGAIKPDAEGNCMVKNRIYRAALEAVCSSIDAPLPSPVEPFPHKQGGPVYHIHVEKAQGMVIGDDTEVKQNFRNDPSEDDTQPHAEDEHRPPEG